MLQESLVYRFVYGIFSYIGKIWNESIAARILLRVASFFRNIFSGSTIISLLSREGWISRAYDGSLLYKLVNGLINLPQWIFHPLYKKAETVMHESALFKVLLYLLDRLHLMVAGFLFITLIVPHQYWNNLYSTIAVTILLLLYFIKTIISGKTGFYTGAFNVFLVLFLLSTILAELFSIMPANSLRFLAFYLTCFLLVLLLIATIRTKKEMSEILTVLLLGISVTGLYGIYQYIVGVPVNVSWVDIDVNQGSMTRIYSFFFNPNNYAEIIIMFLPFYAAAFFNAKSVLTKLIYLCLAVPPFIALFMTLSRSAWIAVALSGLVFVFFKEKRLIPLFILLGIAVIPFLPQSIILRLRTIVNPQDSSTATRVQIYRTVLPILKDYWFTGLGLGNETLLRVSKNYYSFIGKSIPSHSHNLYLQVWLETGLPGFLSFMAFIGATVKKSIKSLSRGGDAYIKHILIAGVSALSGILAMGMVEYVWFYQRVMLLFWAVIGLILAALFIQTEDGEKVGEKV